MLTIDRMIIPLTYPFFEHMILTPITLTSHPLLYSTFAGSSVFYRPKDKAVHADNAKMNFARGGGGDHLALLRWVCLFCRDVFRRVCKREGGRERVREGGGK